MVSWKSAHSKRKTSCQASHRQMCGKESLPCVPKTSQEGFVRHKTDCPSPVLVPHCNAREEAFPWMHGTHPSSSLELPPALKTPSGTQMSSTGLGLVFLGSWRIKTAFCPATKGLSVQKQPHSEPSTGICQPLSLPNTPDRQRGTPSTDSSAGL